MHKTSAILQAPNSSPSNSTICKRLCLGATHPLGHASTNWIKYPYTFSNNQIYIKNLIQILLICLKSPSISHNIATDTLLWKPLCLAGIKVVYNLFEHNSTYIVSQLIFQLNLAIIIALSKFNPDRHKLLGALFPMAF